MNAERPLWRPTAEQLDEIDSGRFSTAWYSFSLKLFLIQEKKNSGLRTMGMEMTGGGSKRIYV
jgi:hypothetical protein